MKDNLQDLIKYTNSVDGIDLIKVTGTDTQTNIIGISEDKTVIVEGTFNTVIPDFTGVFGIPNLGALKIKLDIEEYEKDAVITVSKNKEDEPEAIKFQNKANDCNNEHRLMAKAIIEERIKNFSFRGVKWNVTFEPAVANIQRFKRQIAAHNSEQHFTAKTVNNDLKFFIGDPSTHNASFVFYSGITGTLSKAWRWPIKVFLSIMDLPGDKTVKISDEGAVEITVDSGLATYCYRIPAQAK